MNEIAQGLSALSSALAVIKQLKDIDKAYDLAELRLQMANLYGDLADARIALADAQSAISEKDRQIADLKANTSGRLQIETHHGFPFGRSNDGKLLKDPFCPICIQKDGTQALLNWSMAMRETQCPRCKAHWRKVPHSKEGGDPDYS